MALRNSSIDSAPALRMEGITKRFGDVTALDAVDFEVVPGEIHALLGENGAGKTTLMHVLYGHLAPDAGSIALGGQPVVIRGPRDARAAGIGLVHQHLMLVETLTVAENLALDRGMTRGFCYRRGSEEAWATELAASFGLTMAGDRLVRELSLGERQRIEIVKALSSGARLLVMDEPTSVLTPAEADELFAALRKLAAQGRGIVFISHRLSEVMELCQRVTVLKRGQLQGTVRISETTPHDLAFRMVGHELEEQAARVRRPRNEPLLRVEGLTIEDDRGKVAVESATFSVSRGEIVGVAGIEGNGQRELAEALAGTREANTGSVRLAGADMTRASPLDRARAGLGSIPEDRSTTGLIRQMSVTENLALRAHRRPEMGIGPFTRNDLWRERAERLLAEHDIRPRDPGLPMTSLSGGNQQKVLLARELAENPAVLIASNPTRGLDVGATESLHRKLFEARDAGMALLVFSTDIDEILKLSDRVLVAFRGSFAELPARELTRGAIGARMGGLE